MLEPQTANLGSPVTSYGIEVIAYGWSRRFGSSKWSSPLATAAWWQGAAMIPAFVSTRIDPFGVPLSGC